MFPGKYRWGVVLLAGLMALAGCTDSIERQLKDAVGPSTNADQPLFKYAGITSLLINEAIRKATSVLDEYYDPDYAVNPGRYCFELPELGVVTGQGRTEFEACFDSTGAFVFEFLGIIANHNVGFTLGFGRGGHGAPFVFSNIEPSHATYAISGQAILLVGGQTGTLTFGNLSYPQNATGDSYPTGRVEIDLVSTQISICFDGTAQACARLTGGAIGDRTLLINLRNGQTREEDCSC
jgi:hypothetical protein